MFRLMVHHEVPVRLFKPLLWAIALRLVGAMVVGALALTVAAGLALIALPGLIVGRTILRWTAERRPRENRPGPSIIEADYRVIDQR